MKHCNKISFNNNDYKRFVPLPDADANKYSRGVCNVFAGSFKYPGAAILCSRAAEISGSGYVRLFSTSAILKNIAVSNPSIVSSDLDFLSQIDFDFLNNKKSSCVVGPGYVPASNINRKVLNKLCEKYRGPLLIDGGSLSDLSSKKIQKAIIKRGNNNLSTILTPHIGEAKKIVKYLNPKFDFECRGVWAKAAYLISNKLNCICVLKGPNTLVCNKNYIHLYTLGGSELSVAGSGDVLAGIIGSILSTHKSDAFLSSCLGVHIHALAAKMASHELNKLSVTAPIIIEFIPDAINKILY